MVAQRNQVVFWHLFVSCQIIVWLNEHVTSAELRAAVSVLLEVKSGVASCVYER